VITAAEWAAFTAGVRAGSSTESTSNEKAQTSLTYGTRGEAHLVTVSPLAVLINCISPRQEPFQDP
jgi:hypothetical protein